MPQPGRKAWSDLGQRCKIVATFASAYIVLLPWFSGIVHPEFRSWAFHAYCAMILTAWFSGSLGAIANKWLVRAPYRVLFVQVIAGFLVQILGTGTLILLDGRVFSQGGAWGTEWLKDVAFIILVTSMLSWVWLMNLISVLVVFALFKATKPNNVRT